MFTLTTVFGLDFQVIRQQIQGIFLNKFQEKLHFYAKLHECVGHRC